MPDFLSDYWLYHSMYEIPRNYALWAGIGLLSSIVHKHVLYLHGDLEIHGTMYIGLIGPQGSSKSTCCSFARGFYQSACPDGMVGPSRTSPEKVAEIMNGPKFVRCFTNAQGESIEVKPYAFFINEFKNFVGRSPFDMITFLTDIYDVKSYDASTIARGQELIINPAVNILMCETPDWFIKNVKGDIITGGISRRFVLVYETDETEPKSFIIISPEARAAQERIKQRLIDVRSVTGQFTWSQDAKQPYDKWYRDNHARRVKEGNQVMRGYLKSKHIQLFKVMMMLDASSDKPNLSFSKDLLEHGVFLLESVEKNMPKLSLAAGRNEMMGPQLKVMEILEIGWEGEPGWMPKKLLARAIESELNPTETYSVLRHLIETEQVLEKEYDFPVEINGEKKTVRRMMIVLPSKYQKQQESNEVKIKKKD